MKRFALEDVLSCDQVDSFNKGEYDFFALGDWLKPVRIWLYPSPMESEEEFWHRVSRERFNTHELQVHIPASFGVTLGNLISSFANVSSLMLGINLLINHL